jgi:hypothetical protein
VEVSAIQYQDFFR